MVYSRAHWVLLHQPGIEWFKTVSEARQLRHARIQPQIVIFRSQDRRHSIMHIGHQGFGLTVRMLQISTTSPAGSRQRSHRPAKPKTESSIMPKLYGCFSFGPSFSHSQNESAGIKQRRRLRASRKAGFSAAGPLRVQESSAWV